MSRVVVIGATGHIGTYLVPRLVDGGHEVIAISRGTRGPYHESPQWDTVTRVTADREAEDAAGMFGRRIAALHPEVVIDLICFSAGSARQLLEELRPSRPLLVHCGTIWVHGQALRVPVTEDEPRTAYGEYGTGKAEIEALLHAETSLAAGAARWFGREPVLDFVGWEEFTRRAGPEHAEVTREHTARSITASIARAREVLGYAPRSTPCARRWPGSPPTARQMWAASPSSVLSACARLEKLERVLASVTA
jgi:hypothetical protein